MADVKDPKIAEGEHRQQARPADLMIAYEKIRSKDDDLTWALLDYEVCSASSAILQASHLMRWGLTI